MRSFVVFVVGKGTVCSVFNPQNSLIRTNLEYFHSFSQRGETGVTAGRERHTQSLRDVSVHQVGYLVGALREYIVVFGRTREAEGSPDVDRRAGRIPTSIFDQTRFAGRVQSALLA